MIQQQQQEGNFNECHALNRCWTKYKNPSLTTPQERTVKCPLKVPRSKAILWSLEIKSLQNEQVFLWVLCSRIELGLLVGLVLLLSGIVSSTWTVELESVVVSGNGESWSWQVGWRDFHQVSPIPSQYSTTSVNDVRSRRTKVFTDKL